MAAVGLFGTFESDSHFYGVCGRGGHGAMDSIGHKVMALTLEADQKLEKVGLIAFFHHGEKSWLEDAKKAYAYLRERFPDNVSPRPDDVAKVLRPIIEVDKALQAELARKKLTQKYWISYFTDLILDRCWYTITKDAPK